MEEHWIRGTSSSSMAARRLSSLTLCLRKAAALSHLMRSISMPKPEATPGYTSACRIGLPSRRELKFGHVTEVSKQEGT